MCICPSLPRRYSSDGDVAIERVDAESDGTEAAEPGETHETNVSVVSEIGGGQEFVELFATVVERDDAHD